MSDKKDGFDIAAIVQLGLMVAIGYLLLTRQPSSPTPTPDPKPVTVTIEKATAGVFPLVRSEHTRIFNKAADMIRSKEIKHDKELFDYVNAATKAAREAASKPFDVAFEATLPRDAEGSFLNMEEQAAKVLERVAKSW